MPSQAVGSPEDRLRRSIENSRVEGANSEVRYE